MLRCPVMMAAMAAPPIGTRIRLRRQALHLTQQQLAEKLGVARDTVSAWERGAQSPARNEGRLVEVLGISLATDSEQRVLRDDYERSLWSELAYMKDDEQRWQIIEASRAAAAGKRAG
jgi:transcriptional regulator with XRE-family HTH domain